MSQTHLLLLQSSPPLPNHVLRELVNRGAGSTELPVRPRQHVYPIKEIQKIPINKIEKKHQLSRYVMESATSKAFLYYIIAVHVVPNIKFKLYGVLDLSSSNYIFAQACTAKWL